MPADFPVFIESPFVEHIGRVEFAGSQHGRFHVEIMGYDLAVFPETGRPDVAHGNGLHHALKELTNALLPVKGRGKRDEGCVTAMMPFAIVGTQVNDAGHIALTEFFED